MDEEISAFSWYRLCWYGSLHGQVIQVMDACHRAVALEADNGLFRDSRGIARVLLKDFQGAIADFQLVVDHAIEDGDWNKIKQQRQAWIEALQRGENPLTPAVVKQLLEESV